jgi:ComF family protein
MLRLWHTLLDLLYPPACCHCSSPTNGADFCTDCSARIQQPQPPLCPACGIPFRTRADSDHLCARCLTDRPAFGCARAAAIYDASEPAEHPLKSTVQRYKYNLDVGLVAPLSRLLARNCALDLDDYDLVLPVPLHLARLRWRGFNQALLLAQRIARGHRVEVNPFLLERVRPTQPQVELDETARRRNVARAFRVIDAAGVRGRRVLLVDDVYTTGSTVNECSRALLRAGAAGVDVLVLARAVMR